MYLLYMCMCSGLSVQFPAKVSPESRNCTGSSWGLPCTIQGFDIDAYQCAADGVNMCAAKRQGG